MKFIFTLALAIISYSLAAQELTLQPSKAELVVNVNGLTAMTALQFNLELPEGASISNETTLGEATEGHTLCVETLNNGDHLFILYSMNLDKFKDGDLLRIPININNNGTARLYNIRFADTDAVSHEGADITTGIALMEDGRSKTEDGSIYNLSGQRLGKIQKGINITNGKKILR